MASNVLTVNNEPKYTKACLFRHFNMVSNIYHDPNYNFLLNRMAKYGSCPQDIVVVMANTRVMSGVSLHLTKNGCFSDTMKISKWPSILALAVI